MYLEGNKPVLQVICSSTTFQAARFLKDIPEVAALNKRLQWQLSNLNRGLVYIPLDLKSAKLFVFVDGSFANNKDLSSQIGYEIILANGQFTADSNFNFRGNMIRWSSTKTKRVTRSVLASEIYGMVAGVDMAIAIGSTRLWFVLTPAHSTSALSNLVRHERSD